MKQRKKFKIKDIIKYELIGLKAEIVGSKNKDNIGIKGQIIDETKHTLIIKSKGAKKRVFKENIILKITINNQTMNIEGKLLSGRPKERIQK